MKLNLRNALHSAMRQHSGVNVVSQMRGCKNEKRICWHMLWTTVF